MQCRCWGDCCDGYEGSDCSTLTACSASDISCVNGDPSGYVLSGCSCSCWYGYTGSNCGTEIDECSGVSCGNGSCLDYIGYYKCDCDTGYEGDHCETEINECDSWKCHNGGTCNDMIGYATCSCVAGYSGDNCEVNIDECASNPCQNEATCIDLVNDYACICADGYDGRNCENNIDECTEWDLCIANYTESCEDGVDDYTCNCILGYDGKNCQNNIDDCASSPCQNSGICTDLVNDYNCTCAIGYDGYNCENDIDECIGNLCDNNSTCVDDIGYYTCHCGFGWSMTYCDVKTDCTTDDRDCLNGGTVYGQHLHGCYCACAHSWSGDNCEIDTFSPTPSPTYSPSLSPTEMPTETPTRDPTPIPTQTPSIAPTDIPTQSPSQAPTETPTKTPSQTPTEAPSKTPSEAPTEAPTKIPSQAPTETPTTIPSEIPTKIPTDTPSQIPTERPSQIPSEKPSTNPTFYIPPTMTPTIQRSSFARTKEVLVNIPHSEVSNIGPILLTTSSMATILGLDVGQVVTGTIYTEMLFDDQASGNQRRLTDYIIVTYFVYFLESQEMTLGISELASAFASQILEDQGFSYSVQVMTTTDYNMSNGFMEPTAIPRCMGTETCFNLQEGDGYCYLDSDCGQHLKCGKNCMEFAKIGISEYYKTGGWADHGHCCYDELMFTSESNVTWNSLNLYTIIIGGALILCLMLAVVYIFKRRSKLLAIGEPNEKLSLEDWSTRDNVLANDSRDCDGSPRIVLEFNSSENSDQVEGGNKPKAKSLQCDPIPLPNKTTNCGKRGENSERPMFAEAEGHDSKRSCNIEVKIDHDVALTGGSFPKEVAMSTLTNARTVKNDDFMDEHVKNKPNIKQVNLSDTEHSIEEVNESKFGDTNIVSSGNENLITLGEESL